MKDEAVLFFCIVMIILSLYRIVFSILFLTKKRYILDEKFYIAFFYESIVSIMVLFTNWIIVGIVLALCLPVILLLYVAIFKSRSMWIINGYTISESTFVNRLIEEDEKYSDSSYRTKKIRFYKKKKENRIKIELSIENYKDKEKIVSIINEVCKTHTTSVNKSEIYKLLAYCILITFLLFVILMVLVL